MSESECAGTGKCHGCMDWCQDCGTVRHVCDARLRGERCDVHPVPAPANVIRSALDAARAKTLKARQDLADAAQEYDEANAAMVARLAYDRQLAVQERATMEAS